MKNKSLLFFIMFMMPLGIIAQTQQGYVKTLGRPEKKGEALSDVTVRVKGEHNHVISKTNGKFELLLTNLKNGDAYSLQQVQKNGYELNESDMIGRKLAFSDKVPLTIVMVSSAQLQADKQRIENNAFETAEKNYKAKYNLLEKQLNDNKITAEQYQEEIHDLQDKFEKYQSLIDGLAEHYAHTDYDELDEKDREINICIENGDLERADSLIHTLFDPIDVLKRNKDALAKLDMQIDEANAIIAQANEDMAAVLKQQEKDAEYLYQLYTIALARYDNEKAQFYIETRAALDTTNAEWQFDAGYYSDQQNAYEKAKMYYLRALGIYRNKNQEDLLGYGIEMAYTMNNLAQVHFNVLEIRESEALFLEALDLCNKLENEDTRIREPKILVLTNLITLYARTQRFSEGKSMLDECINYLQPIVKDSLIYENPSLYVSLLNKIPYFFSSAWELASRGQNISSSKANHLLEGLDISNFLLYYKNSTNGDILQYGPIAIRLLLIEADVYLKSLHFSECEKCLEEAVDISRTLVDIDPKAYNPSLITCLAHLALCYQEENKLDKSEALNREAIQIIGQLSESDADVHEPIEADILNSLAILYKKTQRFQESETTFLESLKIRRHLAEKNPDAFEPYVEIGLNNLALLYQETNRYKESELLYTESLELCRHLVEKNPDTFAPDLARTLNNIAILYAKSQQFIKSEPYYKESLEIYRNLVMDDPVQFEPIIGEILLDLANLYIYLQRYDESESMYREALEINRELYKQAPDAYEPILAQTTKGLATLLYYNQQYQECEALLKDALELGRHLAINNPSDYELYLVTVLNKLANIYRDSQRYRESEQMYRELIQIDRRLVERDPDFNIPGLTQDLLDYAFLNAIQNQFQEAITKAEECVQLSKTLYDKNIDTQSLYLSSLQLVGDLYSSINNYNKAYQTIEELLPILRVKSKENKALFQENFVNTLGNQSYQSILIKNYEKAEQYAREAISINPSQHWIYTNLAAALLFQGKYAEAEQIYQRLKEELKDSLIQDLQDFEAAGVIPKERKNDVERIKKMLQE